MSPTFVNWYLVRHAPVAGARQGIYRSLDGDADLSNEDALRRAARILPSDARWWSSPMRRTRQTADALSAIVKPEERPVVDQRLREQDFGAWHGLTFEALWEKIQDLPPHNWSYLAPESAPPGGENYLSLWDRVTSFVNERANEPNVESHVLVTHAGVIRSVVGQAFGLAPTRALAIALDTLSVTKLTQRVSPESPGTVEQGGDWELRFLNRA